MKILIVGAGPTGLTAALELARQGVIPEIVDAKEKPSELSRAVGILPKSIEILKASGVSKGILKEGIKIRNMKIHHNSKLLIDFDMGNYFDNEDLVIGLPQDRTEALMSEALVKFGTKVKYGTKVVDIKTSQEEATVTFENGQSKKYDWVIGADGVNSTIREKLEIKYLGYELPETWSIADLELQQTNNQDSFYTWIIGEAKRDIAVMVPLDSQRVRLVSSTPNSIEVLPIKLNIKKVRREGTFKIPVKQAESYVKGRVLLAGDSAHVHSPVGGRGMNLGIDDVVEAVKAILENKTDQYNRERRKKGNQVIRKTEKGRKLLTSNNVFSKMFIRLTFFLLRNFPALKKIAMRNLVRL